MKTTVEIRDDLLAKAKRQAVAEGTTLRDVLERGLQLVLATSTTETAPQFHWKRFPARLIKPLTTLGVNELIDQVRGDAEASALGESGKGG